MSRREERTKSAGKADDDEQRGFDREGHHLRSSTGMLPDDASHRLGDTDVGISLAG